MGHEKPSGKGRRSDGRRHRRAYGYRGYGSGFVRGSRRYGGVVHWGSGFGGVGIPADGGNTLPNFGVFGPEPWSPGPDAGLSPRGYEPSDERIREDICEELTRRSDIDPRCMTVTVEDGEVTLEGVVENSRSRNLAQEVAERSPGVRCVDNRLRSERGHSNNPPS